MRLSEVEVNPQANKKNGRKTVLLPSQANPLLASARFFESDIPAVAGRVIAEFQQRMLERLSATTGQAYAYDLHRPGALALGGFRERVYILEDMAKPAVQVESEHVSLVSSWRRRPTSMRTSMEGV